MLNLRDPQTDQHVIYSRSNYSLATMTRSVVDGLSKRGSPGGLEGRVNEALKRNMNQERYRGGVFVPLDAMGPRTQSLELATRSVLATPLPSSPLEFTTVLRSKSAAGMLGVRFASLQGTGQMLASIPTKTSATAVGWIADGDPAPQASPVIVADEGGATKTLAVLMLVERKVWNSTDDEFHDYLVADIAAGFAAEIDKAVIAGAGDLEPIGLLDLDGVPIQAFGTNGGPATRAALVAAMKAVHNANGDASATAAMGWLTSPDGEAVLRLTDGSAGESGAWLWSDADRILGKKAVSTTSVPANLTKGSGTGLTALAYGNWNDVVVNLSPTMQLNIDPKSLRDDGAVRVLAFLDVRVLFRHAESFVLFKDLATS
ncbi:phage major capsid protein [Planctomyces sp. SH-PL62]|uniref:phage major capsid protein n=1 Tax=Planctomyces sp. SH-PL62 TaxID=1636152 RepID=UPI00078B3AF7|nr:phage major capsid protein [Planctomyces sp. SH-PL62]AMV41062.1 Phage capsid family protein [Planctomyces sp. SH-PL62]